MSERKFNTNLTPEGIEKNFEKIDFFSGIMEGLEEALKFEKGNVNALARKRSLPSVNVAEIRKSLNMTQKMFASVLGVTCRTVEAWECGKSNPTPTAKKLIYLISENHSLAEKLM